MGKRQRLQRVKRNVFLAILGVLERENFELEDYLLRKRLAKCLQAFRLRARQRAISRIKTERAIAAYKMVAAKRVFNLLRNNAAVRKEMQKDAITRQLLYASDDDD